MDRLNTTDYGLLIPGSKLARETARRGAISRDAVGCKRVLFLLVVFLAAVGMVMGSAACGGSTPLPNLTETRIAVLPRSLSFSAFAGGESPDIETLEIVRGGGGSLAYSLTDNAAWLTVDPETGFSSGETVSHFVEVDITGLAAGIHRAEITISSSDAVNSPQIVSVTLELEEQPAFFMETFTRTVGGRESGARPL